MNSDCSVVMLVSFDIGVPTPDYLAFVICPLSGVAVMPQHDVSVAVSVPFRS